MESGQVKGRSDLSQRLEDYWLSLYSGGRIPYYDEFDVLDIPDLIPHLLVVESAIKPGGPITIKLAGSEIRARLKLDLTGRDVVELYGKEHTELLGQSVTAMVEKPCGVHQFNHVRQQDAENTITEMTGFPLASREKGKCFLIMLVHWVGFSMTEKVELPIKVMTSETYDWIDLGKGVPEDL